MLCDGSRMGLDGGIQLHRGIISEKFGMLVRPKLENRRKLGVDLCGWFNAASVSWEN